ncbi:hypothetical protein nbrc107696_37580 [Gordonia spumicola]|uniref:Uncharacterized protein n=1 Tax=Gordonia spumicola TaxID=589161 RepID=A0A7I9VDM1_9ACTN|nr:hypothetical protein [Gordonia spumicola]GEE03312.1 hypothetical protein nbrc107696_37580 [Gordonia spumicola]
MSTVRTVVTSALALTIACLTAVAAPGVAHAGPPGPRSPDFGSSSLPAPGREPRQQFKVHFNFFVDRTEENYGVTIKTAYSNCVEEAAPANLSFTVPMKPRDFDVERTETFTMQPEDRLSGAGFPTLCMFQTTYQVWAVHVTTSTGTQDWQVELQNGDVVWGKAGKRIIVDRVADGVEVYILGSDLG